MLVSRKVMEQKQETGAKALQRKKAPKRINSRFWDQYENDDYDTNESNDTQSNGKANSNDIGNLNI